MGNTNSKTQDDAITRAHELVACGRSQYPLPQDVGSIEHSKRLNTVVTQLEQILREKKPPLDVVQAISEQLAGLLDSQEAKKFYAAWEAGIAKDREARENARKEQNEQNPELESQR